MQVFQLKSLDELAPYADDWDRLAGGIPFRGWTWLSHWWQCYGPAPGAAATAQLAVLLAFDEANTLIGVAPWYSEHSALHGTVLKMLGSGEVCSDYLSLLCQPGMENGVTHAVAEYLTAGPADYPDAPLSWDLLELSGVDFEDEAVARLAEHLAGQGCLIDRRHNVNCWRLDLPRAWDEYLDRFSADFRKKIRRLWRKYFDAGRAVLHTVEQIEQLPPALDRLIDMHQRRRRKLGELGSFASKRFSAFIHAVLPELMRKGQLHFYWLELDGRPVAAEYHLASGGAVYEYQAGFDPDASDHQPGKLLNMAVIRRAIEKGYRVVDFLRGDEPYKPHFRAVPRPSLVFRIVPNRPSARWRLHLWQAGAQVKAWIKNGVKGSDE
jgi:hypothetical protein